MKHTLHIAILVLFNLLLLLPHAVLGDESTSFQNEGSTIENATPSNMESGNYSMQDTGTTWRPSATESESYATGGNAESGSESGGSDSPQTADTGGGGGSGESGGRRARIPEGPAIATTPTTTQHDESPAPSKTPSPSRAPIGSVEAGRSPGGLRPQAIVDQTNMDVIGRQESDTEETDRQGVTDVTHEAAPPTEMLSPLRRTISRFTASVIDTQFSKTKLTSVTAVDASILARLGYVYRASALYETIPAYASAESMTGAAGFMMRPGFAGISTLVPFFGWRRKRKNSA